MLRLLLYLSFISIIFSLDYPKFLSDLTKITTQATSSVNNRPVIGIYALPSQYPKLYNASEYTFIGASYVNWIHGAGARVVPISSHSDFNTLKQLFKQLNGILFTGGIGALVENGEWTQYAQNMQYLLELQKEAYEKGDYFPIWGTCMGFEALAVVISQNKTLLTKVDDLNRHGNIKFVNRSQSVIFSNLSSTLANYMETGKPNLFDHHDGVTVESFQNQPALNSVLKLTSTGNKLMVAYFIFLAMTVPTNIEIVASFEHKKYPIFATQFHPEKNQYIWLKAVNVSHTYEAMLVGQYIANQFVQNCRKNFHQFTSKEDLNSLIIYNYQWISVPNYYMGGFFFNSTLDHKYEDY